MNHPTSAIDGLIERSRAIASIRPCFARQHPQARRHDAATDHIASVEVIAAHAHIMAGLPFCFVKVWVGSSQQPPQKRHNLKTARLKEGGARSPTRVDTNHISA